MAAPLWIAPVTQQPRGAAKPIQRDFTVSFREILIFPRKTDTAFHPATMKSCVCFCIFEQGRIVLKTAVFRNWARTREKCAGHPEGRRPSGTRFCRRQSLVCYTFVPADAKRGDAAYGQHTFERQEHGYKAANGSEQICVRAEKERRYIKPPSGVFRQNFRLQPGQHHWGSLPVTQQPPSMISPLFAACSASYVGIPYTISMGWP